MPAHDPERATPDAAPPTEEELRLLSEAQSAAKRAYARYSGIHVGAALLDEDGRVHLGTNVENSSYGLTLCAERVALGRAVADGARSFHAVAVFADVARALPPCGACRQVLAEFSPRLRVVWQGAEDEPRAASLGELLPAALRPDHVEAAERAAGEEEDSDPQDS